MFYIRLVHKLLGGVPQSSSICCTFASYTSYWVVSPKVPQFVAHPPRTQVTGWCPPKFLNLLHIRLVHKLLGGVPQSSSICCTSASYTSYWVVSPKVPQFVAQYITVQCCLLTLAPQLMFYIRLVHKLLGGVPQSSSICCTVYNSSMLLAHARPTINVLHSPRTQVTGWCPPKFLNLLHSMRE